MNRTGRTLTRLAIVGLALTVPGTPVPGQVVVGPVRVRAGEPGQLAFAPVMPVDGAMGDAIGDPWWDEADAGDMPGAPAADAVEQAEQPNPGDLRAGIEQVVRQQGLETLRRELSLVRQVCPSLERQQRALVLQAGRLAVERLVADPRVAASVGRGRRVDFDAAIAEALRISVNANAAADEAAAYAAERGHREARSRRAVVAAIVADVDRHAWLDDAERAALAQALLASFRGRWRPAVTWLQQGAGQDSGPPLPGVDRCVEKVLGMERAATWLGYRQQAQAQAAEDGGVEGQGGRLVVRQQVMGNVGVLQLRIQLGGGPAVAVEPADADAGEDAVEEDE